MSILSSKFDITSVDNPVALASLAQVIPVDSPPALGPEGTPTPGVIPAGAIVKMNTSGKAILATTGNMTSVSPALVFVTVDGDKDFSGAYVHKLSVLHGGITMKTDQYEAGAYQPGLPVSFNVGKIKLAVATNQIIGFVGPAGEDTVNGVLEVILPQGSMAAML